MLKKHTKGEDTITYTLDQTAYDALGNTFGKAINQDSLNRVRDALKGAKASKTKGDAEKVREDLKNATQDELEIAVQVITDNKDLGSIDDFYTAFEKAKQAAKDMSDQAAVSLDSMETKVSTAKSTLSSMGTILTETTSAGGISKDNVKILSTAFKDVKDPRGIEQNVNDLFTTSSSKTYITLAKAVKSVAISESTENGKITLTVDGNKTTVPIHGLGSAAYTNSSAYSSAGHTHTKAQVGLGNVDNTADANKSVKHATTADSATTAGTATNVSAGEGTADAARHVWFSDSTTETKRAYSDKFKYNPVTNNLTVNVTGNAATASSVAWGDITGKPSTYAPSAHNHNDSTITSLNASKLFGTIDIARLPHGALERLVIVEDDTARFKLTTANIQLGDTVKVTKTEKMYYVVDESKLSSEAGYSVYTAGTATSVPSATDGTMTQNAITTALNGKSATGHTHNYAGSSSAGGNANAAVKLATARKIGSASFDGTADITLSQMGLNVPVEITKADYLAKKKAGTLNANTYYNVIDEYDSVNVINDSSVTANSTFSSTKSEKTYAKKSTLVNTTLTASKWTGSSAPYSYVLSVSGVTSSNIVEIDYASNASSTAIEAYQNAMLADGGQTTNQITIKATEKPTVDIPITIVIRNDL